MRPAEVASPPTQVATSPHTVSTGRRRQYQLVAATRATASSSQRTAALRQTARRVSLIGVTLGDEASQDLEGLASGSTPSRKPNNPLPGRSRWPVGIGPTTRGLKGRTA